jgi:hypothetical protein
LIPDFIPILGYLDDLILVPSGIGLALRMIPEQVKNAARVKVSSGIPNKKTKSWLVAGIIILIWLGMIGLIVYKLVHKFNK